MVKLILVYWRDIPSQVIVQRGRTREKALLSSRFQEAIDRAAMRAGKGSSEAYLSEWRRVPSKFETDESASAIAAAQAQKFEAEYSEERLLSLVRAHGVESES